MQVKLLLLIELCKDAKLEQSETMALPPIRVKRTDRLSTGLQHSLTITSKHFFFKSVYKAGKFNDTVTGHYRN